MQHATFGEYTASRSLKQFAPPWVVPTISDNVSWQVCLSLRSPSQPFRTNPRHALIHRGLIGISPPLPFFSPVRLFPLTSRCTMAAILESSSGISPVSSSPTTRTQHREKNVSLDGWQIPAPCSSVSTNWRNLDLLLFELCISCRPTMVPETNENQSCLSWSMRVRAM